VEIRIGIFADSIVCAVVSGGGSKTPSGASPTTFYKRTDAGILIDIYNNLVSYVIPGPAVQAF
jgi:hypothetical protein